MSLVIPLCSGTFNILFLGITMEGGNEEPAYVFIHDFWLGSPCLSFDVVPDSLGESRANDYPLTFQLAAGTQHEKVHCNRIMVVKGTNIHESKTRDCDEEDEESDSDNEDNTPHFVCASIRHRGSVNRIKVTRFNDSIIASSWSELGKVSIWDLTYPLQVVNHGTIMASFTNEVSLKPIFSFNGHTTEGYAMEWSPLIPGMLATGDCSRNIHLWKPSEAGLWHVDERPFNDHIESVEDIQWSPNESNVMASCSVDKSIKIWDIRHVPDRACMINKENAHDSDVNVISWNKNYPFILSGGDDGKLKVWDLRKFEGGDAISVLEYHTAPITSVEWHPTEQTVFAASSEDNRLTLWEISAKRVVEEGEEANSVPGQLLFIHDGQREIKELHWHKQMPGVLISTAIKGFNIMRTLSV